MGIPSYFSFIVKNHGNIVRKIHKLNKNVDNFYLDSNSIVYDCLRALEKEFDGNNKKFEKKLIAAVCIKIDEYIEIIKPTNRVFIAFDGVAPVAKLEQQRNRRYKSHLLTFLKNEFEKQTPTWDKTAITPVQISWKNWQIIQNRTMRIRKNHTTYKSLLSQPAISLEKENINYSDILETMQ